MNKPKKHGGFRREGKLPYTPRPNRARDTINTSGLLSTPAVVGEVQVKRVGTSLSQELLDWLDQESATRSLNKCALLRELVREARSRSLQGIPVSSAKVVTSSGSGGNSSSNSPRGVGQ